MFYFTITSALLMLVAVDVSVPPATRDLRDPVKVIFATPNKASLPRSTPDGPGPSCTAITTCTNHEATITMFRLGGRVIGGNPTIQLLKEKHGSILILYCLGHSQ